MPSEDQFRETNQLNYEDLYSKEEAFLRYPADWVIRFHNMYLKANIPSGRLLDYGCGAGNNSVYFLEHGYDLHGVDVAEASTPLVKRNLEHWHLDPALANKFSIIPKDNVKLPFEDNYFDVVVSNQVLYYLASEDHIRTVCKELSRVLRPGGAIFITMMGPKNYYITSNTYKIHDGKVHEIRLKDPAHRLAGLKEMIYLVETKDELVDLFSQFECLTTGYYDQAMFDMTSGYHWIFIGKNKD